MENIRLLIFLKLLLVGSNSFCQNVEKERVSVHLSYNLIEDNTAHNYSFIEGKLRHFSLDSNHFIAIDSVQEIEKEIIQKEKIMTIEEFSNLAFEIRKSVIDTLNKTVTILLND